MMEFAYVCMPCCACYHFATLESVEELLRLF